ncbi:MAG: preprotein translocase subunit SecE [Minisyncoccota bacterium]
MNRFIQYIKDTKAELVHVKWPTRRQATAFTIFVIVVSLLTSLYLGFFDYLMSLIIRKFVI